MDPTPVGRFAPSPSGPLHRGSLLIAVASYLDVRSRRGRWLLRIEDIDHERCRPEYRQLQLQALHRYGLRWDGEVLVQSERMPIYRAALATLQHSPGLYACDCRRARLQGLSTYPGSCRERQLPWPGHSLRVVVDGRRIDFDDRLQGRQSALPQTQCGDFIVWRRDQSAAYQLAVVIDDAASGVTSVVRGADLLDNTARQIYLQQCLHLPTPSYAHLPLVSDAQGRKLSKQNHAPALPMDDAEAELVQVLALLGHPLERRPGEDCASLLQRAAENFDLRRVPAQYMTAALGSASLAASEG